MTEVCDDQTNELTDSEGSANKQYSESSSFNGSLKRVNSVNSLTIPGNFVVVIINVLFSRIYYFQVLIHYQIHNHVAYRHHHSIRQVENSRS